MTPDAGLDTLLDQIDVLSGRRTVDPLPGGLTNRNYRVRTATHDVVVRVSDPSTGLLAVDREAEFANSVAAADAGIGARVVDYLRGRGVLVVEFVPSRTYADEDVAANPEAVAAAVRRLHSAHAFRNRFDMFGVRRHYLAITSDNGFRMPDGYLDDDEFASRMETALSMRPEPLVSCHNDLLAANFLDDGQRLWIVDYEYSGMNEPSFELGNIVQEAHLGTEYLVDLCRSYYDRDDPALVARAELWSVASAYAWTMWGTIQAAISDLDYDFWGWSMDKYDRARGAFRSARFGELLDVVGGAS